MGLRTTDNLNLEPRDQSPAFLSPQHAVPPAPPLVPGDFSPAMMQALVQLFREKTDAEIATLIPGTTTQKAADIRNMLNNAGLL